jgi:hypothetical protein
MTVGVGTFQVEQYTVTAVPRRLVTTRSLFLVSTPAFHGHIISQATLTFYPSGTGAPQEYGTAYNVGGFSAVGPSIYVNAEHENFDLIYHLLQTEKPVYFKYYYIDTTSTTKQLYWANVTTDPEFVGEGLKDPQAP